MTALRLGQYACLTPTAELFEARLGIIQIEWQRKVFVGS